MLELNLTMQDALQSAAPNAALAAKLQLYGQFVGAWRADIEYRALDGSKRHAEGEWHFGWVLDGKAIQDVWIFPARRLRGERPEPWFGYGSTFRWYNPAIDAWHIAWFDPGRSIELRQIGRAAGRDIVQIGESQPGVLRRWRFTDIADASFRWIGDISWDRGVTWTLDMEMRAARA